MVVRGISMTSLRCCALCNAFDPLVLVEMVIDMPSAGITGVSSHFCELATQIQHEPGLEGFCPYSRECSRLDLPVAGVGVPTHCSRGRNPWFDVSHGPTEGSPWEGSMT